MSLIGYQEIEKKLLQNFQNNKLHHALLFCGNKGIGKAQFARQLAQKIILNSQENEANYNHNLKQIELGSHPNLLVIKREVNQKNPKKELKKDITIDSVRKINGFINLTAADSKYRVIIIDTVDEMNKNSANAILKVLEEPPTNIFFFLITHNSKNIAITIKSRCNLIKIPPLEFSQFSQALIQAEPNIKEDQFKTLFDIANGSVSLALDLHRHNAIELYSDIMSFITNNNPNIRITDLINKITNKDFVWEIFEQIINLYLSQISKTISGVKDINYIFEGEEKILDNHKTQYDLEKTFAVSDKVNQLLNDTKRLNLDKKHTIINIFNMIKS